MTIAAENTDGPRGVIPGEGQPQAPRSIPVEQADRNSRPPGFNDGTYGTYAEQNRRAATHTDPSGPHGARKVKAGEPWND